MKRGSFGVVLLAGLFFLSLTEARSVRQDLTPVAAYMEQASQTVLRGDIEKTAALTGQARAAWEAWRLKYSSLTQQQEVWEIDRLWEEVEVFLTAGETVHCSAACAELKNQVQALMEDQQLSLHNLL